MYRFLLRPKWIAFHLLVLALVVVMINLAFWQIRRLHEREAFNTLVRAHSNQPIEPLDTVLEPTAAPDAVEWRRVTVTGTYLPAGQLEVVNRSQGGDAGRDVVDPLQLRNGSVLLVNRGFVAGADPAPPPPPGEVQLIGQLRRSEVRRLGQPSDSASGRLTEVRRIDIPRLAEQIDAPVRPMYLQLLTSTPPEGPSIAPVAPPVLDNGPHLSYTLQWFIFSACAIIGWVLAVRRGATSRSGRQPRRRHSPPPIADELSQV